MVELLLIWTFDQQDEGDNVHSSLIRLIGYSTVSRLVFTGVYLPEKLV
jgi:hypothetical protein